jgi:hypothetical protein
MIDNVLYIKKLIYNWCIRDDRYGMTLPNLIGAIKFYNNNEDYNIENFFRDLPEVDLDIKISSCPDLMEFVFGTFKSEDAPKNYYNKVNSIYYSKNELNIENYEELISFFKDKYSTKIENGLYSKNYYTKEWSDLTKEDNDFLKSID